MTTTALDEGCRCWFSASAEAVATDNSRAVRALMSSPCARGGMVNTYTLLSCSTSSIMAVRATQRKRATAPRTLLSSNITSARAAALQTSQASCSQTERGPPDHIVRWLPTAARYQPCGRRVGTQSQRQHRLRYAPIKQAVPREHVNSAHKRPMAAIARVNHGHVQQRLVWQNICRRNAPMPKLCCRATCASSTCRFPAWPRSCSSIANETGTCQQAPPTAQPVW